ncbi:hypothetical protein [Nonomuraea sp. NPDC049400]|uniref:hypothetical protein n=1 Tax=Nonomuraea sp. NPDC049400 TaxID=3364352 RepID=UPI00379946F8
MDAPRIIATAADLVSVGESCRPETPVVLTAPEIEPGADPHADTWVLVATPTVKPMNAHGGIAAPGEPRAYVVDIDEHGVLKRARVVQVLQVGARQVRTPGQIGSDAMLADPELRRIDALHRPDGDMRPLLMEDVARVDVLREGIQDAIDAPHQPLAPAVVRRLEHALDALAAARLELEDALRYGDSCELARLRIVDDDRPCPARLGDVLVFLPDSPGAASGQVQPGCRPHAALAERTLAGTHIVARE